MTPADALAAWIAEHPELPRHEAALAFLDVWIAEHPELRGEAAAGRLAALADTAAAAGVDVDQLGAVAAAAARTLNDLHEAALDTPPADNR